MTKQEKKIKIHVMQAVQAVHRNAEGTLITNGVVRVELPHLDNNGESIKIYYGSKDSKFTVFSPLSYLTSIPTSNQTINLLCKEYNCYLSEEPLLIVEDTDKGLSERTRNILQAIIAIDGTIRIRKALNARVVSSTPSEEPGTSTAASSGETLHRVAKDRRGSRRDGK